MENPMNRKKYEEAIEAALAVPTIKARVEAIIKQEQQRTADMTAKQISGSSETTRTYHALVAAGLPLGAWACFLLGFSLVGRRSMDASSTRRTFLGSTLAAASLTALGQRAAHAGALTMGSATSDDIEAWLLVYRELLDPVRYLIATDSDAGGNEAARRWLEKSGRSRRWKPPSPCKDVTDLWQMAGYEGVRWWILEGLKKYANG